MTSTNPFDDHLDDDVLPVPGAETRVPEFHEADPGPFAQFHQPTPPSPIIRRIGAGPFKMLIGGLGLVAIVILLSETFSLYSAITLVSDIGGIRKSRGGCLGSCSGEM